MWWKKRTEPCKLSPDFHHPPRHMHENTHTNKEIELVKIFFYKVIFLN